MKALFVRVFDKENEREQHRMGGGEWSRGYDDMGMMGWYDDKVFESYGDERKITL
jgi:hypothetical protein